MAFVSVIIPNYNCSDWLPQTIESCLIQIEYLKEIIIVDDFSDDNSWEILTEYSNRYPEIIKIYKNKNKGGNNARNYGFSMSSGDYIQWLDADDEITEGKLSRQLKCFDGSVDIVYSDWVLDIYQNKKLIQKEYKKNKQINDFIFHLLSDKWSTPHCYLLKRNIAEKLFSVQAWNPATTVLQDREYFTMAAIIGAKFKYTPGFFAIYRRWNENSVSRKPNMNYRYKNMQNMFDRFEEAINTASCISFYKKKRYINAMDTQRILATIAGFSANFKRKPTLQSITWGMMPGIRTTFKVISKVLFYKKNKLSTS